MAENNMSVFCYFATLLQDNEVFDVEVWFFDNCSSELGLVVIRSLNITWISFLFLSSESFTVGFLTLFKPSCKVA